ncbi:hypothetical protein [Spirosoma validum]|uniref:Uncharacterized protein n=1 Tax=Spirosoma validum TaxID=2771355 RepID=A0A927B2I0_9BACT|nr:hypothetical protein [Spirosoma validum]MBD2754169.1 hypothetical protein [Spirosoma validum]
MKTIILPLINVVIVVILGFMPQLAQSQSADSYVREDSAQAYWRVRAEYANTKPIIQFFDRHHRLIYQEQLPESAQRMTRQSTRAFDVLLSNLTTNRILAMAYLNNTDLSFAAVPSLITTNTSALRQTIRKKGEVIVDINPSLDQMDKLTLRLAQAKHRLIGISLENEDRTRTYFDDCSNQSIYHRNLNLSQMPGGVYRLKVSAYSTSVSYLLTIDRAVSRYYLQKEVKI